MAVPDLLGTQGTFTLFTTRPAGQSFEDGGIRVSLPPGLARHTTVLQGPPNPFAADNRLLEVPLVIEVDTAARKARVTLDGTVLDLATDELSPWMPLSFRAAPGVRVRGLCRVMLTELPGADGAGALSLYVTPINLDPERPAMPISHPAYYSRCLALKIGPFATLGLAEDTWARNESVIGEDAFVRQSFDIDDERRAMMLAALDRLERGTLTCVFDATDRIQHMCWRGLSSADAGAIERLYVRNDGLVGTLLDRLQPDDVLVVLSDHGFTSFDRGVNLNAWLLANGYLFLKDEGSASAEWLHDVDWARTRAYALGLSGLFLNVRGREAVGCVEEGEAAERLRHELCARLSGLPDGDDGAVAIERAVATRDVYSGPYRDEAPDLLIGYAKGYRASWAGAKGVVAGAVIEDNTKAWSGDHCVDPAVVPGVLFCSRPIPRSDPGLVDLAPTILGIFGLAAPAHMDGRDLFAHG
jgi:hypothetical protein